MEMRSERGQGACDAKDDVREDAKVEMAMFWAEIALRGKGVGGALEAVRTEVRQVAGQWRERSKGMTGVGDDGEQCVVVPVDAG
jgi:hypothetical protein